MNPFKLVISIALIISIAFVVSACDREKKDEGDTQQQVVESQAEKDFGEQINSALDNQNVNAAPAVTNVNTDTQPATAVTAQDFTVTQLHVDHTDLPHRYELFALAQGPINEALSYVWATNCGYFHDGIDEGQLVTWMYDTAFECVDATVTFGVEDESGNHDEFSRKIFSKPVSGENY